MYTITTISDETGISRDRLKRACKKRGVEILGRVYVIRTEKEKRSIIEEIRKTKRGNPAWIKKNKKKSH